MKDIQGNDSTVGKRVAVSGAGKIHTGVLVKITDLKPEAVTRYREMIARYPNNRWYSEEELADIMETFTVLRDDTRKTLRVGNRKRLLVIP